jgi:5-hydroxyisourate hydrolase-like protein (transthyretin family)
VKRIGFVLIAIVAMALLVPALGTAQSTSTMTVDVTGNVYSGALPVNGATVQIYSWNGQSMGTSPLATTYSKTINNIDGSFDFQGVPYDPSQAQPFEYVIMAQNNGAQAHAMVYVIAPENANETYDVQHVNLDLAMWDWKTDLTGIVQSGNLNQDASGIPNAQINIYPVDQNGTVGQTAVASTTTDSNGQFEIKNVLNYGQYQAVITATYNGNNYISKPNFTAYEQEYLLNVPMTGINIAPKATPTPNAGKSGSSGNTKSSGFFGIPGFESILALVAIGGAAALMIRKR